MQLHRSGDDIQYFSRRGVEHGEYSGYDLFDVVVKKQLKHDKCILDGEMIVWNKARCKDYFLQRVCPPHTVCVTPE